jgi:uncharacterized coiled-coil protein SlyX
LESTVRGKSAAQCELLLIQASAAPAWLQQDTSHRGETMRRTDQERLTDLEAESAFQRQTLRAIRVVAERVPPEETHRALKAIGLLATEALAQAKPKAHQHRTSE